MEDKLNEKQNRAHNIRQGVEAHALNPSIQGVEARGSLRVWSQPALQSKF